MSDRRARHHEATRLQILDVAWRLAREHGLTGWSLRQVAEAMGMRTPSLYVYFASKDAIYDAMFAQGYRQLLAHIDADRPADTDTHGHADGSAADGSAAAILGRTAHSFLRFCVADPPRYQLLFLRVVPGFEPSDDAYELAERVLERLRHELARAGVTAPSSVDLWTAVVTGLATQQISNDPGGERWIGLADRVVAMLLTDHAALHRPRR